jgi:ATP sulfurylase
LGNTGLLAFVERLPDMLGLQQLNIGDYFDNDAAQAVLQTIQRKMELRVLYMESVLYDDEVTETPH